MLHWLCGLFAGTLCHCTLQTFKKSNAIVKLLDRFCVCDRHALTVVIALTLPFWSKSHGCLRARQPKTFASLWIWVPWLWQDTITSCTLLTQCACVCMSYCLPWIWISNMNTRNCPSALPGFTMLYILFFWAMGLGSPLPTLGHGFRTWRRNCQTQTSNGSRKWRRTRSEPWSLSGLQRKAMCLCILAALAHLRVWVCTRSIHMF